MTRWFEYFTERIGGPTVFVAVASGPGVSTLFAAGRAAMHLMGSWEYTRHLNQNPDFAKAKLAWANFPTVDADKGAIEYPNALIGAGQLRLRRAAVS
jgi:ABC-type glycerol-3-phosphate transport system substrate-binding protein